MSKVIISIGIVIILGIGASIFVFRKSPVPEAPEAMGVVATATSTPTVMDTPEVKSKTYTAPPPMTIDVAKSYTATMVTSKGTMKIVLSPKDAPVTVNNFVFLARDGYYNDTIFHRIIKGFMIQGGDPQGNGTGGPGYRFADEPVTREYSKGTIAMANAGPNTNGSQFFVMHADYPLPKNYVIFGSIDPADTASLQTLDAIATTPVGGERPLAPITISSVTIEEK